MGIRQLFNNIYYNDKQLTPEDYNRSRTIFIFEASTANAIFALTSGAFLAGFASYLGANDQFNGIIAAIPAFAGVIQVISPMVFEKLTRRKFLVAIACFVFRLLLGLMVFIPLLVKDTGIRLAMLAGTYFLAYLSASFITPAAGNWIMSLTPDNIRGGYFGRRDSYSLTFMTVISLVMGKIMDIYRQQSNEYTGFLIVFSLVIVFAVINFSFLSSVREPAVQRSDISLDIKNIFKMPLKNRKFRKIILLFFLWNVALQVGAPFFAVYMVTGLRFDYTYIMVISLFSSLASVLVVRIWGKLADKRSWVFTTKLSIGVLAVCHTLWFFVNAHTAPFMVPILYIGGGVAWAGINISLFNIQFIFAPEEGRTIYLGFNAALGGLVGFGTALISSFFVGLLEGYHMELHGFIVGNMQIVFGLSGILTAACVAFIHYYIKTDS